MREQAVFAMRRLADRIAHEKGVVAEYELHARRAKATGDAEGAEALTTWKRTQEELVAKLEADLENLVDAYREAFGAEPPEEEAFLEAC